VEVTDLVAVVAEPNRRRLLQLLGHGEQTVTQLASHFTVSRSAISQHLGVLADIGLVTSRREGKFQYYRLDAGGMAALRAELDSFWTRELDQLARDARAVAPAPQREPLEKGGLDGLREVGARAAECGRYLCLDHRA
jgi:DNA-binding transcriptional ArsR family regulator